MDSDYLKICTLNPKAPTKKVKVINIKSIEEPKVNNRKFSIKAKQSKKNK